MLNDKAMCYEEATKLVEVQTTTCRCVFLLKNSHARSMQVCVFKLSRRSSRNSIAIFYRNISGPTIVVANYILYLKNRPFRKSHVRKEFASETNTLNKCRYLLCLHSTFFPQSRLLKPLTIPRGVLYSHIRFGEVISLGPTVS